MTQRRRVAITGIGLVTPVGNDVATTWGALDGVKSGAAPITVFDASGFPTRIAAEVKRFDERAITAPRKLLNQANRSQRFALAAARSRGHRRGSRMLYTRVPVPLEPQAANVGFLGRSRAHRSVE